MIETWATQRHVRIFSAGSTLIASFVTTLFLLRQNDFTIGLVIFSVGLAALVGTGKLASP